jgi:2-iminobutanoate/2-iminopropanoate deaminase
MPKRYIGNVPGVPTLPSPISNAVVVGNTCHISGQLAVYDDGYRAGTARQEATRAFDLTFLIVEAAGFARDDIVYVDIAFADLARDFPDVNTLFGTLFKDKPARTVYQAAALPYGAKVKVQVVAMK